MKLEKWIKNVKSFLYSKNYNIYEQHIINIIGKIPKICGTYNFVNKTLEIHPNDLDTFKKLFLFNINNNYGNGELAIYWLFRDQHICFDKQRSNDLILNGTRIELKKYTAVKLIKIGKIPKDLDIKMVELQTILNKIDKKYLSSKLTKTVFKEILSINTNLDDFKNLCKEIILKTLMKKTGEHGIIINFRSDSKGDIYNINFNNINLDLCLNHVSFNEGYLHLELEKIFDEKQD